MRKFGCGSRVLHRTEEGLFFGFISGEKLLACPADPDECQVEQHKSTTPAQSSATQVPVLGVAPFLNPIY